MGLFGMSGAERAELGMLRRRVAVLEAAVGELCDRAGVDRADLADPYAPSPEVVELALSGRKVAAIKRYRELTGLGLAESKEAVDAIAR